MQRSYALRVATWSRVAVETRLALRFSCSANGASAAPVVQRSRSCAGSRGCSAVRARCAVRVSRCLVSCGCERLPMPAPPGRRRRGGVSSGKILVGVLPLALPSASRAARRASAGASEPGVEPLAHCIEVQNARQLAQAVGEGTRHACLEDNGCAAPCSPRLALRLWAGCCLRVQASDAR